MFFLARTITIALLAFAPEPEAESEGTMWIGSRVAGKFYAIKLPGDAIRNSPVWKEGADSPPVSPRKALRLAKQTRRLFFRDQRFRLQSMHLVPIENNWIWQVTFVVEPDVEIEATREIPLAGAKPEFLQLVVLMDGTVPEPYEVPYDMTEGPPPAETQSDPKESPNSN